MSSVRMCDRCGSVFSELAEGWQTFTGTTFRKDDKGARVSVNQTLDACPSCAIAPPDSQAPPALINPGASSDPRFFERADREQKMEQRIAELEQRLDAPKETDEPAAAPAAAS